MYVRERYRIHVCKGIQWIKIWWSEFGSSSTNGSGYPHLSQGGQAKQPQSFVIASRLMLAPLPVQLIWQIADEKRSVRTELIRLLL